jgi:hypothetical protein
VTLLQDIQESAIDSGTSMSTLLRKAKVLAARLGNPEFTQWVDWELNGYPKNGNLPPYRVVSVNVRGNLSDAYGYRQWNGAPIMTTFLPEEFRDWGQTAYLNQPISLYESLLGKAGEIQSPWPQELANRYGAEGYTGWECLGAWQVLSRSSLVGLIDLVRNRLLEFVIEIGATAPDAGEAAPGITPVPQATVAQVFNTVMMGGVNNVAAGNANVTQSNSGQLSVGDLNSLIDYLRGIGIPSSTVGDLERCLKSDTDKKTVAEGWVGKLAMTAATGAMSAGFALAAKAVAAYLGLPSP